MAVGLRFGQPGGTHRYVVTAAKFVPNGAPRQGLGFLEQGEAGSEVAAGFGLAQLLQGLEQGEEECFLRGPDADDQAATRLMLASK